MSYSNRKLVSLLVEKGIITTGDLDNGGKLNPKQANQFIDFVIDVTGLNNMCRVVRFRNEKMQIDKIGVGRRVSMPASEARDPGTRRKVTTSKIEIQPKKIMTPFEISDEFEEHNIEGASVSDKIVRLMSIQTGNDIEELGIVGNSLGPAVLESELLDDGSDTHYVKDTFLALGDGWLVQADSGHLLDAGGAAISANVFSELFLKLPVKFRKNKKRLRFLVSSDIEQMYRERLSTRSTAMGDIALTSDGNIVVFGIPLVPVPLLARNPLTVENVTFTGSGSTVNLTKSGILAGSVVVTPTSLGSSPTAAYVETTDYTVDETAGTITHAGGGSAIGATATVKVTYNSSPEIILTHMDNMIFAIGRDITIEKDRDIFAQLNQYAISTKVDYIFEEIDCVAKAYNIANTL